MNISVGETLRSTGVVEEGVEPRTKYSMYGYGREGIAIKSKSVGIVLIPTKPDATSATINHFAAKKEKGKEEKEGGRTIWIEKEKERKERGKRKRELRG